jgi:transcriptional regulator with XRE-family HTH domain
MSKDDKAESPGAEIKRRRAAVGLSVQALAARCHVDRGHLAKIEKGTAPNTRGSTIGKIRAEAGVR